MTLGQFTESRLLVPALVSEWRDSAIYELSQRLENAHRIDNATAFTHAVLDHESKGSGVFDDVAFPLAGGQNVKELSFALGLSEHGVRWGTARTPIVHTVILFAVTLAEEERYLSLLMMISSFLKDEVAFSALRRCSQAEEMWTILNRVSCVRKGPAASIAR